MFDIFTEEIEILIKEGVSNLYWYKKDMKKLWLRSGVKVSITEEIYGLRNDENKTLTKRQLLDSLYEKMRTFERNRRLEISRNFARALVEHQNFVPQDSNHRIEKAQTASLRLKEVVTKQLKEKEIREAKKRKIRETAKDNYETKLIQLREKFIEIFKIESPQKRGLALEPFFTELMNLSGIQVFEPFRITGEQIDGAIKYDSNYFLIELKWQKEKVNQQSISSLYLKADGKLGSKGIFISMDGFSSEVIESLPRGKDLKIILLDGNHLSNVIFGNYKFVDLLEHAISQASLKGNLYCSHNLM